MVWTTRSDTYTEEEERLWDASKHIIYLTRSLADAKEKHDEEERAHRAEDIAMRDAIASLVQSLATEGMEPPLSVLMSDFNRYAASTGTPEVTPGASLPVQMPPHTTTGEEGDGGDEGMSGKEAGVTPAKQPAHGTDGGSEGKSGKMEGVALAKQPAHEADGGDEGKFRKAVDAAHAKHPAHGKGGV